MTVLVVEDDLDLQRRIAQAAEPLQVCFASTGQGALDAAQTTRPWLVLLDYGLPDMTGLDVLQRLRADPHTRLLPVVIFSSLRDARRIHAALDAGANAWVVKPDDPQDLSHCVKAILRFWTAAAHPCT
jgi:DNA-binding response OmpR family regulator